jgi:hypothetical protein
VERVVTTSADRREMTIATSDGRRVHLRSARPQGFTDEDLEAARDVSLNTSLIPGQVNRARQFRIAGRKVLLHANTGPPTWWWPRVETGSNWAMVGWLRGLIAVSWHTNSGR